MKEVLTNILALIWLFSTIGLFIILVFYIAIPREELIKSRTKQEVSNAQNEILKISDYCYKQKGLFRIVNNKPFCEYYQQ